MSRGDNSKPVTRAAGTVLLAGAAPVLLRAGGVQNIQTQIGHLSLTIQTAVESDVDFDDVGGSSPVSTRASAKAKNCVACDLTHTWMLLPLI